MELYKEIVVNAPAATAWAILGEQFGQIAAWAAPITASSLEGEPRIGAVRTCHIARFGPVAPGAIKERLIAFDAQAKSFAYEAVEGMPGFIGRAVNRWSVHARDEKSCIVRTHATLTLRGPAALLGILLKWKMQVDGGRVIEELQHFIERGQPHPRKLGRISECPQTP